MSSVLAPTPGAAYRRQTPTIWQALGRTLWQTLEQVGQRRAARELRDLAQRWEAIDAPLAKQLRAAAQHDTTSSLKETA